MLSNNNICIPLLMLNFCSYDPVNYSMLIESEAQKPIILQGLYEMNGQILVLPIIGTGQCKISLGSNKIFFDIHFQLKLIRTQCWCIFFRKLQACW